SLFTRSLTRFYSAGRSLIAMPNLCKVADSIWGDGDFPTLLLLIQSLPGNLDDVIRLDIFHSRYLGLCIFGIVHIALEHLAQHFHGDVIAIDCARGNERT